MARRLLATVALALLPVLAGASPARAAWTWPVDGEVITLYLNGPDPYAAGQHRGVDIAGAVGAPVIAATAGLVRFAGVAGSSGLTVSVRTSHGDLDLSYLHLSELAVSAGQRVAAGARIGAVGTTGRRSAARPHVHFGVRDAGSAHGYHDPLAFLPPPGGPAPRSPRPVPVSAPAPVSLRPAPEGRRPAQVPGRLPRAEPVGRPAPLAHPRLGPAPGPVARAADLPVPRALPAADGRGGVDLGWLTACAGALSVVLALSAARMHPRRRGSPGERPRPASSIAMRCRTTSPRRSTT